jgi:hypothetical protein
VITFLDREFDGDILPSMIDKKPVALIAIDARGLDFLIEELPRTDDFTRELTTLREKARAALWERAAR